MLVAKVMITKTNDLRTAGVEVSCSIEGMQCAKVALFVKEMYSEGS